MCKGGGWCYLQSLPLSDQLARRFLEGGLCLTIELGTGLYRLGTGLYM